VKALASFTLKNSRRGYYMSSMIQYKVPIKNFKILNIDNSIVNNGKISYCKERTIDEKKASINVSVQMKENENNIFILEVMSKEDLYERELMPIATKLINDLLNKIAFCYPLARVGEPWITQLDFKQKKTETSEMLCSMSINAEDSDKKLLESLCEQIQGSKDLSFDYYTIFRAAMNNEDIVVKYMFLYQILLSRHVNKDGRESQKSVDEFIKSNVSEDKHMYQKWEDTGYEETIYTRLRNQVGHFRQKTSSETRNAMDTKINELIDLVKKSISF
jgi:hypothetical protein